MCRNTCPGISPDDGASADRAFPSYYKRFAGI
jgi:hypothetical protein